jgi:hypothetical protein
MLVRVFQSAKYGSIALCCCLYHFVAYASVCSFSLRIPLKIHSICDHAFRRPILFAAPFTLRRDHSPAIIPEFDTPPDQIGEDLQRHARDVFSPTDVVGDLAAAERSRTHSCAVVTLLVCGKMRRQRGCRGHHPSRREHQEHYRFAVQHAWYIPGTAWIVSRVFCRC